MKKLGFGIMRLPLLDKSDESTVDVERAKEMVDLFLARGFTYFDCAWMYHGGRSESLAKELLVDRYPRESFTLATKMHAVFFETAEQREEIFNKQLEKTGAGYFDYYLLHGVSSGNIEKYEKFDSFRWMQEKKELGLVRHIGFSYHADAKLLDDILARHPEVEFVQLQINYLDWESEWVQSRACYETARRHGLPIVVMEPVKGGTLTKLPREAAELFRSKAPDMSPASWAIRFAASLEGVMVVLSGMSDLRQVEDNLGFMDNFTPLDADEIALTRRAAEMITARIAVPCTGCSYCTGGCPKNIPIPQYFSLYNDIAREDMEEKVWTAGYGSYDLLAKKFGRARDCVACGQCETVCPQHLPVIERLKDVSASFDN